MKKYFLLFICIGFVVASMKSQTTTQSNAVNNNNTLLWKISGKNALPSYLYGTFHLLCKEDIHFGAATDAAMAAVKEVYMELDLDDPGAMLSGIMYMNMQDGKKLKDFYTEAEFKRVEDYFNDTLKTPLAMFQKIKPYFLAALLYPKMLACEDVSGVDQELSKKAKKNNTPITGLETVQFQASVFDSIPYEWQAKELLKNIDSARQYKIEFAKMVKAYTAHQLDAMESMVDSSGFTADKFDDILLKKRNLAWAEKLDSVMAATPVFIAVGAGHLIGEKGLIQLFRKKGFTVTAVMDN
ncbi:MAG: TraB/GumN family protein [Ginsengibacter sp.]